MNEKAPAETTSLALLPSLEVHKGPCAPAVWVNDPL